MTLTIKLDGNWSSFQLANSAPPLSVTGSAIAPSARIWKRTCLNIIVTVRRLSGVLDEVVSRVAAWACRCFRTRPAASRPAQEPAPAKVRCGSTPPILARPRVFARARRRPLLRGGEVRRCTCGPLQQGTRKHSEQLSEQSMQFKPRMMAVRATMCACSPKRGSFNGLAVRRRNVRRTVPSAAAPPESGTLVVASVDPARMWHFCVASPDHFWAVARWLRAAYSRTDAGGPSKNTCQNLALDTSQTYLA